MASMEKISADLKLLDSKKENLRKAFEHSLLLLTLQWKDLEEYFDSTRKSIEQRFDELNSKEKQFDSVQLSFKERSEELNSIQKSIEERLKELRLKEEKIDLSRLSTEERSKELDSIQESINESFKELGNKEKELDSVQKLIDQRVEEFKSKEKQFDKGFKELELKENQFDSIQKSIENRFKELEGKDKRYHERAKQLELKEKRYEELSKSLELKEKKRVLSSKVKVEETEYMPVNNAIYSSSSANIRFCVTMDGKTLQLFLNERLNEHDSMRDEVYAALRMSSDPAKLVLDAMQGFYPPFSKEGDKEFEGSVVRRSCTLLLGQLMRVSPHITPHVREEATKLAVDWKAKMKVESENPLEALGFLQLVATYGLISAFARDEISKIFETIAQHREVPGLCRALGFADKVPDLIQKLIEGEQRLVAINYIYAYGLVDKFPPVPLLKGHLTYSEEIADKIRKEGNNSLKAQGRATKQEVDALRAVIKCITDYGLESEFSPENLNTCIEQLERKSADQRIVVQHPAYEAQPQNQAGKKIITPTPAPSSEAQPQKEAGIKCIAATPALAPSSEAQLQKQYGKKCIAPSPASKSPPQKRTRRRLRRDKKRHLPLPLPLPLPLLLPLRLRLNCKSKIGKNVLAQHLHSRIHRKRELGEDSAELKNRIAPVPAPVPALSPSSEAQLEKQDGKKCIAPAPASKDPLQKRTRRRVKKGIAPTPAPAPSSLAQPQKEAGIKCNATSPAPAPAPAPAPSFESQRQRQAGKICIAPAPASETQPQKQASKKRIAPTPVPASKTKLQHQCAEKRLRTAILEAAASKAPVGTACPVHSEQPPPQRPAYLFPVQGASYLRRPAEYCSPRGSTPLTSRVSHLNWQYGSGAPANSAMAFGSAGYHFGSAANFYRPPSWLQVHVTSIPNHYDPAHRVYTSVANGYFDRQA